MARVFTLARCCGAALGLALLLAGCGDSSGQAEVTGVDTAAVTIRHGVDYSWYRPSPASLPAQGYTFAARYLSHDTTGKNLSKSEADALIAAGVDIVSNWEDTATNALSGYGQGASDAQAAEAQATADGAPSTRPIYFSVDFDATPGQQTAIDAYFDGVASVIGVSRTGAYGGYYVIQRLFNAGKITFGWQTYAWSGGQWDPRAQLRQIQNGIAGGQMDEDESVADDFGEWGHTPPPPPPDQPRGYLDQATCALVAGWTQDPQVAGTPIFADVYFNGPAGGAGVEGIRLTADNPRTDLCTAIGSCDHGYSMPTPRGLMDGKAHPVYAYGINHTPGGLNSLLRNSPKSVTCAPPAIAAGTVKRHVVNPTILADWRFDTFLDMATYTVAAIAAVPDGADLGAAPRIVQAKGDPAVYVADGAYRRHIVDPASLAAWRLTGADVKPITAADLAAFTAGPDWPQAPLLAKDPTDPSVYMLDTPYPASKPDGGTGPGDGGAPGPGDDGGSPSGDDGGAGDGASPGASSGCSAGGPGSPDWAWLFFVPGAVVFARRGRKS